MVLTAGFEPAASALSGRRSHLLSYASVIVLLASLRMIGHCWHMRSTFPKDQLTAAIRGARSWRQVNTRLGRSPEASTTNLKTLAGEYQIDIEHLSGQRRRSYTDDQLRAAVAEHVTWADVATALGKNPRSGAVRKTLRTVAERLELDVKHLEVRRRPAASE